MSNFIIFYHFFFYSNKYANTKNGYNMRHMGDPRARHQFPEYEELKRDSPGGGIRKFFLAVYIIIGSLVTAALIALVVLAPTRDSLYEAGILAKEPLYWLLLCKLDFWN